MVAVLASYAVAVRANYKLVKVSCNAGEPARVHTSCTDKADANLFLCAQADPVDFVRQGALVAMALVLMQQPEARVAPFRKQLAKFVGDKHEEVMCRCELHSVCLKLAESRLRRSSDLPQRSNCL